jgi:tetratricopeptide (TPR) repeat protein
MDGSMVKVMVIALAMSLAAVAHAQPADPADAAYREGRRLYDLREWDGAIAKFKEAYRLRSDAASLFDIAQAYRLKGDCVEAQSFYKTYRRNFPTAANIAKVDKFIADLDACVKTAKPTPPSPTPRPAPTEPVQPPSNPGGEIGRVPQETGWPGSRPPTNRTDVDPGSDPRSQTQTQTQTPSSPGPTPGAQPTLGTALPLQTDDPNAGRTQRIAGLTIAGAGAVAVAAGVVFGLQAISKSNAVQQGHGTWDPTLEQDGQAAESRAESLLAIGGAAVVVGSILYYYGRHEAPHIAVQPRAGGAMMVWSCGL